MVHKQDTTQTGPYQMVGGIATDTNLHDEIFDEKIENEIASINKKREALAVLKFVLDDDYKSLRNMKV